MSPNHRDHADDDRELPVVRAGDLPALEPGAHWLVRDVWGQQAVGFCGGQPKCAKSFLGLDIALSVASGTPCLDRFAVDDRGPALVYLAEDALPRVRERLSALCSHRSLDLAALDLHVITAPAVRLDLEGDQKRLDATLARRRPKLLLLDPLVRLHRLDEDSSADISALLGFLREMQRRHAVAILIVHHMGKRVRAHLGQALRGSSDLHAFGDDNAYVTRHAGDRLRLTLEHRSAPSGEPLDLRLAARPDGSATHLEIVAAHTQASPAPLADKILDVLRNARARLPRAELRARLRVNNERLGEALAELENARHVTRYPDGYAAST
jgi:hypothetical protein